MSILDILLSIIKDIKIIDILDIMLLSWGIYRVLLLIEGTRAYNLLKGLGTIFLVLVITKDLDFNTVNWVLANTLPTGFLALVVIFQPELRRALEDIGKGTLFTDVIFSSENISEIVEEITKSIEFLSSKKIGALIVFEQEIGLRDFIEKGVRLHSHISTELINTIFLPFTPLHDGAVIIKGGYIEAASCFLPISQNPELAREVGTRHRAAVGISEITDALAIIISEETGTISFAKGGRLVRDLSVEKTREIVRTALKKVVKNKRLFAFNSK